jgi:protease-4
MNPRIITAFVAFLIVFIVIGLAARALAQNMMWGSGSGDRVALIHVEGMITGASAPAGLFAVDSVSSSLNLVDELYRARDDNSIKAVVLRVNSPGGTAAGSDEIYRAIDALSAEKPVVVSMGDVAASGGYYIASAADYIFANGATLTGSIGVVFNLLNF